MGVPSAGFRVFGFRLRFFQLQFRASGLWDPLRAI